MAVTEKGHGRVETRTLQATTVQAGIGFPHAKVAMRIERTRIRRSARQMARSKASTQVVYAITDLTYDQVSTVELAAGLRRHWVIENRLHHVRDVTFDEDRSQVRTGSAAVVMATLRNTVITLLRHQRETNIAAGRRALAAHPDRALALVA